MDRLVSVMGVKFAMNNTSKLLHHGIAHFFPKFSDSIGELTLERYNIPVEYESTNEGKQDYISVKEMLDLVQLHILNFQNMFIEVIKVAWDNDDVQVYSDLLKLMQKYNFLVEQAILLVDKIDIYGDDIASFDAHITDYFWILDK